MLLGFSADVLLPFSKGKNQITLTRSKEYNINIRMYNLQIEGELLLFCLMMSKKS